eukprot:1900282-Rhodomonas_salina.1
MERWSVLSKVALEVCPPFLRSACSGSAAIDGGVVAVYACIAALLDALLPFMAAVRPYVEATLLFMAALGWDADANGGCSTARARCRRARWER